MKIKKVPLQCRKKRHYNDTIFQLKQHVSWVNGPDSHFGMTQKLKYKIIVAQDIVGVKCKSKLDIDLPGRYCERNKKYLKATRVLLFQRKYLSEVMEAYSKRIYPDRVGSRI